MALGDGEGFTAVFGLFDDDETRTSALGIEETLLLVSRGRLPLTNKPSFLSCRYCSPTPPFKQKAFLHHSTTAENKRTHLNDAAPGLRPFAVSMFLPVFLLSQTDGGEHAHVNAHHHQPDFWNHCQVQQNCHSTVPRSRCDHRVWCCLSVLRFSFRGCKIVWQVSKTTFGFHSSSRTTMRRIVEVGAVGGRCEW